MNCRYPIANCRFGRARCIRTAFAFLLFQFATGHWQLTTAAPIEAVAPPEKHASVVRVNVTNQAYDFFHPWSKRAPYSRRALGAVLAGKQVLVTAELVENANY